MHITGPGRANPHVLGRRIMQSDVKKHSTSAGMQPIATCLYEDVDRKVLVAMIEKKKTSNCIPNS